MLNGCLFMIQPLNCAVKQVRMGLEKWDEWPFLVTRVREDCAQDTLVTYFYRCIYYARRARGSVVGWCTMLQAGRSRVRFLMRSLDFSIVLILAVALWPWSRLNLYVAFLVSKNLNCATQLRNSGQGVSDLTQRLHRNTSTSRYQTWTPRTVQ
jgi:hypothetical protein